MPKLVVFFLSLVVILFASVVILNSGKSSPSYVPGRNPQNDTAANQAQHFFNLRKQTKENFSTGPCLSNNLMPGWVADIVHNPRLPVDDLPENQCSAFREGKASHFVELDLEGNIIRVQ